MSTHTEDLWGPTIPCGDCAAEVRWEDWDSHQCPERERQLDAQIVELEARLGRLRTLRDLRKHGSQDRR